MRIYAPVPPERLHPSSGPGYARSTFPVGEGNLRRGRRTEVLRIYAPVPPGRLHPSSVRAVGPATFPAGEGCLPAGEGDLRRGCSGGGT